MEVKTQRNRQKNGRGTSSGYVVQLLFGKRRTSFFFWLYVEMEIGLMSVFVNEASNVSALSGKWLWQWQTQCKNQSTLRVDRRKSHSSALIEDQIFVNFLESQHVSLLPATEEEWGTPAPEALLWWTWRTTSSPSLPVKIDGAPCVCCSCDFEFDAENSLAVTHPRFLAKISSYFQKKCMRHV